MKKSNYGCLIIFGLSLFHFAIATTTTNDMKVGVIELPPFAMVNADGVQTGLSVDLWREIAQKENFHFTLVPLGQNIDIATQALLAHQVDVLIGPFAITPRRIQQVSFTQPYFMTQVSLITKKSEFSFIETLSKVLGKFSLQTFLGFLILFFLYLNVFWYCEKSEIQEMPRGYFKGLGHIFWAVLLKRSAVPFFPKTIHAKLLSSLWILISILFFTYLTASVTAVFVMKLVGNEETVIKLPSLIDKPLAAIAGSYEETKAKKISDDVSSTASFDEAMRLLMDDKVFAVLAGRTVSEYAIPRKQKSALRFSQLVLGYINYGFAFADQTPLMNRVNFDILTMQASGEAQAICKKYLGHSDDVNDCNI